MFCIRNPIFKKYKEKYDRYKNGPSFIPTPIWKKMVGKWMKEKWGVSINEIHVINSLDLSQTIICLIIIIIIIIIYRN